MHATFRGQWLAIDCGTIHPLRTVVIFIAAVLAVGLSFTTEAFAQNSGPYIFDVRRSLPLEPGEPRYHDFYINAGPEAGFRKGSFVSVVRAIPVHDPIQNKQQGTLNIPVGRLHVIHVEKGITVARLHSELGDEERPTVEFEAIMIGDKVDLASITSTDPGGKKRARPQAPTPKPTETAATTQPAVEEMMKASGPEAIAPAVTPAQPETLPSVSPLNSPSTTEAERNSFPLVAQPDMNTLKPRQVDFFGF